MCSTLFNFKLSQGFIIDDPALGCSHCVEVDYVADVSEEHIAFINSAEGRSVV
jgi:hypothetical protein